MEQRPSGKNVFFVSRDTINMSYTPVYGSYVIINRFTASTVPGNAHQLETVYNLTQIGL